jgi:transcription elongation factor
MCLFFVNSAATVGVIYKVERGFARVVDQSGMTREVEPHLITQKRDSSRAIATDAEGNSIQDGDSVREMTGAVSFIRSRKNSSLVVDILPESS